MAQATLNGILTNDGGAGCQVRFQWGSSPALGNFTPWQGGFALHTGAAFLSIITGLVGGLTYYFRSEAQNSIGSGLGAILSFIVALPAVAILPPTGIIDTEATLNGQVISDGGFPGTVRFQWGATSAYGMLTPWQDGFATGSLFSALITGLKPGTAYHCRAEFKNSHGPPVFSRDLTFSTLPNQGGLVLIADDTLTLLLEGK